MHSYPRPELFRIILAATAALSFSPAIAAAQDADCESAVRAVMRNTEVPVPIRYSATTEMSGQTMENSGITQTPTRSMSMDADGNPVSLFVDGKFYTSEDKGETWTLRHEYSEAELKIQSDSVQWQADNASNIECEFNVELDGKTVHHFAADFPHFTTKTATHTEYWVDADTGFVWKALTVSDTGGSKVTITQHQKPDPDATVPVPAD